MVSFTWILSYFDIHYFSKDKAVFKNIRSNFWHIFSICTGANVKFKLKLTLSTWHYFISFFIFSQVLTFKWKIPVISWINKKKIYARSIWYMMYLKRTCLRKVSIHALCICISSLKKSTSLGWLKKQTYQLICHSVKLDIIYYFLVFSSSV